MRLVPSPTFLDEIVDGTLVVVQGNDPLATSQWDAHVARLVARRPEITGVVVLAHGPGPDARQRKQLQDAWGPGRPPPIAIVEASVMMRGVIIALNWFMQNRLKAFAFDDLRSALGYADVKPASRPLVLDAIRRHAVTLGVASGSERARASG